MREALLRHHLEIDLAPLVLVVARLGPVDQGADHEAEIPVTHAELGGSPAVRRHLHLRIAEVETRDRDRLGFGDVLTDSHHHLATERDELLEVRPIELDVDAPSLTQSRERRCSTDW